MKKHVVFCFLLLSAAFLVFTLGYGLGQRPAAGAVTVSVAKSTSPALATQAAAEAPSATTQAVSTTAETIHYPLNINGALMEDLMTLPEMDEILAQNILDYRLKHGRFASIEELKNVYGMGEKHFAAIEDYITVLD